MEKYSIENYISSFSTAFGKTTDAITQMGKVYADAIAHYPSTARKSFAKRYPQIQESTWEALELIGTGKMNPKAFFLRLTIRREVAELPISLQDSIFKGDCPCFKVVDPKNMRTATVCVSNLDNSQFRILFDKANCKVRTPEEQKTLIKNTVQSVPKVAERDERKYRFVGNKVEIGGVRLSLDELDEIRRELYERIYE